MCVFCTGNNTNYDLLRMENACACVAYASAEYQKNNKVFFRVLPTDCLFCEVLEREKIPVGEKISQE